MLALLPKMAQAAALPGSGPATFAVTSTDSRNASIQAVLVAVLGHLEHAWQQQDLKDVLLNLPLPAMSLLLSSDKLTVYSEDTVLYTACKFVAAQATPEQQATLERLSAVIRVPQLSDFQLMLQSMRGDWLPGDVLQNHTYSVQRLVSLKRLGLSEGELVAQMKSNIPASPSSWSCGPRQVVGVPSGGVKLTWGVPVSRIKAAVLECQQTQVDSDLKSDDSPPLAGLEWYLLARCTYDTAGNGVLFGIFVAASSPSGFRQAIHQFFIQVYFNLEVPCMQFADTCKTPPLSEDSYTTWTWPDFLGLTVRGGWDESAWVAKGLPAGGEFTVTLSILKVY